MRTDFNVSLNGVNIIDLDESIFVEDINEIPKTGIQTENRASYGLSVTNEPEREQLDITISLKVKNPDRLSRQRIFSAINGWAKSGWLRTNLHDNQRIYAVCTQPLSHKAFSRSETMEITFTAYNESYWQEIAPTVLSLSGTVASGTIRPRGTRKCFLEAEITNTSGGTINAISITANYQTFAFTGLSLPNGGTLEIYYDEQHLLRADASWSGFGQMSHLTYDSDDHIILQPNEPATVSFSATGTCSVKIYARGMYD